MGQFDGVVEGQAVESSDVTLELRVETASAEVCQDGNGEAPVDKWRQGSGKSS